MAILERYDTDAIAHLTLNMPDRLNALSDEMLAALKSELDALKDDRRVRAVILSGAGKAFCAGYSGSAPPSALNKTGQCSRR